MDDVLVYAIALLTMFNIARLTVFLIGADIYDLKHYRISNKRPKNLKKYQPLVRVLIPAHNEEQVIIRCLESVLRNDYQRFRVIVIDDGSTDSTYNKVRYYIAKHKLKNRVRLITQKNAGKGAALNNALKRHVKSGLVMVLDSDSTIASDAIRLDVEYLAQHPQVVATTANIKIMPDKKLLGLVQEYEYIISNRMRKSFSVVNAEYVIGGVGSLFKLSIIKKAGYYSSDTITEDLDLTFKIIQLGNKKNRIGYAANVHAYTEGVMTFRELIKQRYRWKFGRFQAYFKHRNLFFSSADIHDKRLTKLMLPYTILMDVLFLFEPIIFALLVAAAIYYGGGLVFAYGYAVITMYVGFHLAVDNTLKLRRKALLLLLAPVVYFLLAIASIVEYVALLRAVARLPKLRRNNSSENGNWQHVRRSGQQLPN